MLKQYSGTGYTKNIILKQYYKLVTYLYYSYGSISANFKLIIKNGSDSTDGWYIEMGKLCNRLMSLFKLKPVNHLSQKNDCVWKISDGS